MAKIESQPLQPLNPDAAITEQDRFRMYSIIGKELNNLLNGSASFYADGVQKDGQSLLSDLNRFKASVQALQGVVNDPSNILGGAIEHLNSFTQRFEKRLSANQPSDDIQLKPEHAPNTEDNNIIYVDPNINPRDSFPNSNPVAPENWNKQHDASLGSFKQSNLGGNDYNGSLHNGSLYNGDYAGQPGSTQMQPPTENAFPMVPNGARGTPGGYPLASQRMAPQPALPVQNLTAHALRMKGVPEADIGAAINDPAQMRDLLNQLYGRRAMIAPGDDSGGFGSKAGQDSSANQPDQASTPAATPDTYIPFGWSGLPALLR
jgi:hypothetical protein